MLVVAYVCEPLTVKLPGELVAFTMPTLRLTVAPVNDS